MPSDQKRVRIELTSEQRAIVKEQTGIDLPAVDLTIEELESRVAPLSLNFANVHFNP
jgi:hypothetical protein